MSKAIIVVDLAYKSIKRSGRGTGYRGLKSTLKYLQYRDKRNNQLATNRDHERWQDRGLGIHHGAIMENCGKLQSKHVLAWTWVISPDPELLSLVPEDQRRQLLYDLTERVVEDYYSERGFDCPEYSYLMHSASTKPKGDAAPQEHLHTHVVLPGTAPVSIDRLPVYHNASRGHDQLLRAIATHHFADALDETIGLDWRQLRPDLALNQSDFPQPHDIDIR